jgi:hypothetical protein
MATRKKAAYPKKPRRKTATSRTAPVRILNCEPSPQPENDWSFETALRAGMTRARGIPPSKDLREAWWTIGDQGSTGACVGWATADSVLRWHFVKAGRLAKEEMLSPRFLWMAAKETDAFTTRPSTFIETEGTSLKAALDIARKYGAVKDSFLPIATGKLYPDKIDVFYALAAQLKIASYINLGRDLTAWRTWLANNGPILTRLNVDATWNKAKLTAGNLDSYQTATAGGGHAVALVGYTPDRFIVRNSWGTVLWGQQGFGFASLTYAQTAFTEAYGVTL